MRDAPRLTPLPIDDVLPELLDVLEREGVVILQAPPGAGKSTRVPVAILDSGLCQEEQKIVLLEPRRVAARAVAARIAQERGEGAPGRGEIGYVVRFEKKVSARTRVEVVTEGLLLRRLQHDPFLEDVGCVILDEFHERSIHADLALAMLKELRAARPELKLVVMSATLQMGPLVRYLSARAVTSQGRTFPVDVTHAGSSDDLYADVRDAVATFAARPGEQDALVFLSGARQINEAIARLGPLAKRHNFELYPLYGALSLKEQVRALEASATRRVIVATNIAETSLTVEGVTTVIDSGLVKQLESDPASGLDKLLEVEIAKDSAAQRAGRAGRVRAGRAVRLWSQTAQDRKPAETVPEIRRVDVLSALLDVIAWSGADPVEFDWFEAPTPRAIHSGVALLRALDMLPSAHDSHHGNAFQLTKVGELARELPLHPRLGRMLIEAVRLDIVEEIALGVTILSEGLATSLSHGGRSGQFGSDLLGAVGRFRRDGARLLGGAYRRATRVVEQLLRAARRMKIARSCDEETSLEGRFTLAVFAGFPDRVCLRQSEEDYTMVGGHLLTLGRGSDARGAEWLIALHNAGVRHVSYRERAAGVRERGLIRLAEPIDRALLKARAPERFVSDVEVSFDSDKERFSAQRVERFDGLFLSSTPVSVKEHASPEELAHGLARELASDVVRALSPGKDDLQLLHRVELLRHHRPELDLPALLGVDEHEEHAQETARKTHDLFVQWSWGEKGFKALRRKGLGRLLKESLTHKQREALKRLVPARIKVPSGSMMRVDYEGVDTPPVLAVRIQEIFGWQETPTILDGQVELTCHLLAPNYRPAQVTQDLRSFWTTTYPEVRKELRARYPKHAWPEDPFTAVAVKKGASSKR